jgi:hypothetical protein
MSLQASSPGCAAAPKRGRPETVVDEVKDNSFVGESSLLMPCYPSRLAQWCSAQKGEVR